MNSIVEVQNATKIFKETIALKNINLQLETGKIHGIIGRNGSGKTVLFKCICGFMPLTSGKIIVHGKELTNNIPEDIGIIIEAPGFLPNYSCFNNLKFLARIRDKINDKRIVESIRRVGLDPYNKKWVGKYSLGMRQRLGIAQAIMENPSLLILDEPMNGLDKHGVQDVRNLLLDLKSEGKTVILTSHNIEDIKMLCDTVCEMENGTLEEVDIDYLQNCCGKINNHTV